MLDGPESFRPPGSQGHKGLRVSGGNLTESMLLAERLKLFITER